MFIKNYQLFFILFLISGTAVAVSANSWFTCWVGLEINLMSLIPLMLSELNFKSTEAAIKYFLPQAMASVMLISATCAQSLMNSGYLMETINMVIYVSLAIKAGLAPFHLWFPQVIQCLSWFKSSIILVWQKIAPFMLMTYFSNKMMLHLLIVASAIVGALGGLNQPDLKFMLTYSSIAHSAWMLLLAGLSLISWAVYFLIYSAVLAPILVFFYQMNLRSVTEINKTKMSFFNKILLSISIMSLGGLPPFLGFMAKLTAIIISIKTLPLSILLTLISSSLVSLFFYTKMFYSTTTGASMESSINFLAASNSTSKILLASTVGNVLVPLLVLLI